MLNLQGLAELHKAGQKCVCVCVCVCGREAAHSSSGKSDSIKTSPEADARHPPSMELLCAWPSEPRSGCRGMCISSVPCESQIHLRCTYPPFLSPIQHPIPQIRWLFPALPRASECATERLKHYLYIYRCISNLGKLNYRLKKTWTSSTYYTQVK